MSNLNEEGKGDGAPIDQDAEQDKGQEQEPVEADSKAQEINLAGHDTESPQVAAEPSQDDA